MYKLNPYIGLIRTITNKLDGEGKMTKLHNEHSDEEAKQDDERSLKNAMFNSIIFIGGGLVFFWLLLFLTYTRGY